MGTKTILLFLVIIFALGLTERTTGIISNNILFLFDNGRDLLYVKNIVIDHKLYLIGPSSGGLQGYFHGVLWYYMLTIPFILGKGNPAAFTLFMATMSSLSILTTFFVMKKILNIKSAIIAATIFAFALFSVSTSKFIWNPYPIVWLMPIYIFSLFSFVRKKAYALPLAATIVGLIFNFEAIYGVCLLPILVTLFIVYVFRNIEYKRKIVYVLISIFFFLIPLVPTLVFDLRHSFLISSTLTKTMVEGGENLSHLSNEKQKNLFERISLRINDLYTYSIQSITPNKYVNLLFFGGLLFGIYYMIKHKYAEGIKFITLCIFSLILPFFLFLNLKYAVWGYYWIGNPPLYTLLLSYVLGFVITKYDRYQASLTYAIIIILVILYNPFMYIPIWQKGEINQGAVSLTTQLNIVDTIYADAKGENFSAYVLTPPVYDYVYRYLFWYRGQQLHLNTKKDEKQKLTYYIIEPQPSDKDGSFFKKRTIRTINKPTNIFKFPGEINVEKIYTSPSEEPVDPNYFPRL